MTAKFNTATEARQTAAALFAAGLITAWSDYRSWGKTIVRVQLKGRTWMDLSAALASQVA